MKRLLSIILVFAMLGAGNTWAGQSYTFDVTVAVDGTPPTIIILSPADETVFNESPIAITGTVLDALSDVESVEVNVEGTLYAPALEPDGSFSLADVEIINGPNSIVVSARDLMGNEAEEGITVFLAEYLNITPASATLWTGMTQQFSASGGIAPYAWSSDDEEIGTIDSSGLFSAKKSGSCQVIVTDSYGSTSGASLNVSYPAFGWRERVVSIEGSDQTAPVISENIIAWLDSRGGLQSNIYTYNILTQTETPVTSDDNFRCSPDTTVEDIVWADAGNIYLYNIIAETQDTIYSSPSGLNFAPRISGDRVVWEELKPGEEEDYDIYVHDITTGITAPLITGNSQERSPAISGDLLVWSDNRDGNFDIYMYDFSTEAETPICANADNQTAPAISDDKIVWLDDRNGGADVYMLDSSTGAETAVTSDGALHANLSVDGDKIIYQDYAIGDNDEILKGDIHIYHISTGLDTVLDIAPGEEWAPEVSNDIVVYTDNRNGNWDIFTSEFFFGNPAIILKDTDTESGEYTGSQTVRADLNVKGAIAYMISEDPDFVGAGWVVSSFPVTISYTFDTAVNQTKTVYAKFRNAEGLETEAVNDTIILDTEGPILNGIILSDQSSGSTAKTGNPIVDAAIDASGEPVEMILSENPDFAGADWQGYSDSTTFELSLGDGSKTVYCKVRDIALNESAVANSAIALDTTAPSMPSAFNASCPNNSREVTLSWQNPTDADFEKTMIRRKTSGYPTGINDGDEIYYDMGTSFIDTVPEDETTYYYSAWSRDDVMNWSAVSAGAEVASGDTVAPLPVTNFNATLTSGRIEIELEWDGSLSSDYSGVKILRKTGSYPEGISDGIEIYDGAGTSYTDDNGLSEGTRYCYAAFAYDEVHNYSSAALTEVTIDDFTNPYIDGLLPENGAIQVPRDSVILFHIKDDGTGVDKDTISLRVAGEDINLIDPDIVPEADRDSFQPYALISGAPDDYVVAHKPEENFKCEEIIDVSVTASDFAAGPNTLADDFSFTTEMMPIGANIKVNGDGAPRVAERDNSAIACNASGKIIYVVWEEYNGNDYDIYFAKSTDRGHGFEADIRISDDLPGIDQRTPAIVTDSAGNKVYIIWQERDSQDPQADWDLCLAGSTDEGATFTTYVIPIDEETGGIRGNQTNPDIDFHSSDNVYITWRDDRYGPAIYFAVSENGGDDFTESVLVVDNATTEAPSNPSLKVTSGGNVYVAWDAGSQGNRHIFLDISTDSGETFGEYRQQINDASSSSINPSIDVRGSGNVGKSSGGGNVNVAIAWQHLAADGDTDIYFDKSTDFGATFGDDIQVNEDSQVPHDQTDPSLAIADSGDIYIVWHDRRNFEYGDEGDIYLAESIDKGQSFNTNILVNDDAGGASQKLPALVLDAGGRHVNISWRDERNGEKDIYFAKNTVINTRKSSTIDHDDTQVVTLDDTESPLYGAEVEIPRGALDIDMTITIGEVDNPPALPAGGFGAPIHFGPGNLAFKSPVTVTMPYRSTDNPNGTTEVYYYDSTINAWSAEDIAFVNIDRASRTVTFTTTHFSIFGLGSNGDDGGSGGSGGGSGGDDGGGGGRGCFIATAAYGTPMSKEVRILSLFRDKYLLTNAVGKKFVSLYYKTSPPLARYIAEREYLKKAVRVLLKPIIALSRLLLE